MKSLKVKKLIAIITAIALFPFATFATSTSNGDKNVKSEIEESAINLLSGWSVPYYFNKEHQIFLKANYIKNFKSPINSVILGSSHMQSISSDSVKTDCINLSIGGGTLQDKLNFFGLLEYYDIKYDRVVMDITLIELTNMNFEDNKANPINSFGEYFLDILDKKEKKREPIVDFNKYYKNGDKLDLKVKYKLEDVDKNIFHYRSNLSTAYSVYLTSDEMKNKDVNKKKEFLMTEKLCKDYHINKKAKQIFTKLIEYLNDKKIKVNIIIIPKPPYIYEELNMGSYEIVTEMVNYLTELVTKNLFKLEGFYDPKFMGVTIDDYYDNYHLLPSAFAKYYKFD